MRTRFPQCPNHATRTANTRAERHTQPVTEDSSTRGGIRTRTLRRATVFKTVRLYQLGHPGEATNRKVCAMTDLAIRVQPRAKRTEVAGEREGAVVIRVSAPPVDGKANEAVRRLIATRLGVPLRAVQIVRGETGRDKVVRVDGVDAKTARRALLD